MVVKNRDGVTSPVDAERVDRLIAVLETVANLLTRSLSQSGSARQQRPSTRMRRVPADKPLVVTPMVQAAVKRALARVKR